MRRIQINQDQLHLPFGQSKAARFSLEDRQRFFWFLSGVLLFSIFVYVYAINATARNIAERAALEATVADVGSKLGALEFTYVSMKNNIDIEVARAHGFEEVETPLYVYKQAPTALTLNTVNR